MRRKLVWYVVMLILGLALLAVSCGGPTSAPAEEPVIEEPAVEEPAAGVPMAIPHTLEGRDDCLVCHGEDAFKPFPTDHAGRTSDTCTGCHQAAE